MKKSKSEKLERSMRYVFIILSAMAVVYNLFSQQWEVLFSAILTLILFILPSVLIKRAKIKIPAIFQIIVLLFIFASMYLGEVHHYFYRYHWWDTMLHANSAILLAYIGFLLIYTLNRDKRMYVHLSPLFMALFSFCFALSVGCLWEIFEFGVDAILGVNMQKARNLEEVYGVFDTRLGVIDTMRDLIVDAIGALLVSVVGFIHMTVRKNKDSTFWSLHKQFIEENPDLFDK
ncbi:MAG: hypothetical protein RBR69_09035 [Candidatus Cloacimonadaceae bacterium]|jgi:hypothetical protein|nr:hypothetical protein [Candidatus Cloacimonadota bacterium]MDY0128258.1 hypothetical protein [Candidatus Cloacimonadaceae bacterium]MCB5254567.1 hypothetical protein [Candidatus Cloacimonadota bacterium]MCK9178595.1 hypothetical protein [Candidatus Cloacimonadota bacterium]MCK9242727.1 hypothetical protein [Candidatus Cloacimonadota bacterium]